MEKYQGVKFACKRTVASFTCDNEQLAALNQWTFLLSQLGLTPVHAEGAYGNQSCRTGKSSFLITKSAMVPTEALKMDNFCHVIGYDEAENLFITEGKPVPSSESLLHHLLYQSQPHINAILHGHSTLFLKHASALNIPTTKTYHHYGTRELAESALELLNDKTRFFILKDHGFVALGEDIDAAGRTTLDSLSTLIHIVRNIFAKFRS